MTALSGTPLSRDMLTGTIQTRMKAMLQMDYLYANGYTGTTRSEFRRLVIVTIVAVSHKLKLRK